MRLNVVFIAVALLGAVSATWVPSSRLQPRAEVPDAVQQLRDDIAHLREALRQALSLLSDLFRGPPPPPPSPSSPPGQHPPGAPVVPSTTSTSVNTPAVASSLSASITALASSIDAVSSSLAAASTTTAVIQQPSGFPPAPTPPGPTTMSISCADLCSSLDFPSSLFPVNPVSCVSHAANSTISITGGQADAKCGSTITPEVDLCRVVLTVATSSESETYMEVWLPEGDSEWNGRTMNTDNGGVNGCVHYVDMQYVTGLGFAAIGDNAGHNGSSLDGSWFGGSNQVILDWAYRARHSAVVAGKEVVNRFYDQQPEYSYYIGCSAGGAQGLKSAQMYPEDFDGIIAGSAAADFNHLQAWSGRFVQLTGTSASDPRFLTQAGWITVQAAILAQCDGALDGVDDGILEDPTICEFDASVLSNTTYALTTTQAETVGKVFSELYNTEGNLLFPALLPGSQVDAFRLGQLSGSIQAISETWYKLAVLDDNSWNALDMDQDDYARADELDAQHGYVSSYSGDLSNFSTLGGKLILYHGMADPLVSAGNSQRYYLKVAQTMGLSNTDMDAFFRYFRISGMAHCGVGGISGAGAWMFGQNGAASAASHNIIQDLQDWVEKDVAPDTITGTKYWYDQPANGVQLERAHCRFPYRTTYRGGDANLPGSWGCDLIEKWRECGPGALPRLCNVDGTFEP